MSQKTIRPVHIFKMLWNPLKNECTQQLQVREDVVEFEKALGAVKLIKDRSQYKSQSLLNLACGYFTNYQQFLLYSERKAIIFRKSIIQWDRKCSVILHIMKLCHSRKNLNFQVHQDMELNVGL